MNYLKNFTPAEIIIIKDIKNIKLKDLIKYSFYNLIINNFILVKQIEKNKFCVMKEEFNTNLPYSLHERIIYDIVPKKIELNQFVNELSNYGSKLFKFSSKAYDFESYVYEELLRKNLFKIRKISFLGITFFIRKKKTEQFFIINKNLKKFENNTNDLFWVLKVCSDSELCTLFFNKEWFSTFNKAFDEYYERSVMQKQFVNVPVSLIQSIDKLNDCS